jgi:carbamoyltransferase
MQQKINLKIKRREGFRPFASSVMEEFVGEYFSPAVYSPYMLFVSYFNGRYRNILPDDYENMGIKGKLEFKKSLFPAVTHVDFSSRIQSVNQETNPLFYGLIKEFYKITGCPMILNTSFNLRGEPIVATPEDAYRCFVKTDMDYLVMGNFFIERKKQKYKEEIDLDKLND